MEGQYNLRSPAVKRLMKEAQELREPTEVYYAQPLEDNLFEWHFTIRGPDDTEFAGGLYHGRIVLPPEYPMKPPSIILLTPNGRFETFKKICLSISGHHPESWQPSWSIRTALLAIIGFMPTHGNGAIGSLDYTPEERKKLAKNSNDWKCPDCGCLRNVLKPITEASKKAADEARELATQINFQGENKNGKKNEESDSAAKVQASTPSSASSVPPGMSSSSTPPWTPNTMPFPPTSTSFPMPWFPMMPPMTAPNAASTTNATAVMPPQMMPHPMLMMMMWRAQMAAAMASQPGASHMSGFPPPSRMPPPQLWSMPFSPQMPSSPSLSSSSPRVSAPQTVPGTVASSSTIQPGGVPVATTKPVTPASVSPAHVSPQTVSNPPSLSARSTPDTSAKPEASKMSATPSRSAKSSSSPSSASASSSASDSPSDPTASPSSTSAPGGTSPSTPHVAPPSTSTSPTTPTWQPSQIRPGLRHRRSHPPVGQNAEIPAPILIQRSESPIMLAAMIVLGMSIVLLLARRFLNVNLWKFDTDF